jgi:hypothetical protein
MMDNSERDSSPSAEHAWSMLMRLQECVVRSLERGDEYDILVKAVRDARDLLSRYAAGDGPALEQRWAGHEPQRNAA